MNVKKIATVFLVLLFFSSASWAGTTGKLAGLVKDTQTGEALPGVAVQIVGTTIGAATNIEGEYFIINVPPGRYRIKASLVGYTPVEVRDVKVSLDLTDAAKAFLAKSGFDPVYGARPLKRTIQHVIQDPLALQILEGNIQEGAHVKVDVKNGKLVFK